MDTNITPNLDPSTLQDTLQTQTSAVISSDLATNVTNKNLDDLAKEEEMVRIRAERKRLLEEQRALEAAKKQPSAVDQKINETLGVQQPVVDIRQQAKEQEILQIRNQIRSISEQVDPITARMLADIELLLLNN